MRLDRHNSEVVEPPFGLVGAVADDEMVASQGLVAHEEAYFGVGVGGLFFVEDDRVLRVAYGHCA